VIWRISDAPPILQTLLILTIVPMFYAHLRLRVKRPETIWGLTWASKFCTLTIGFIFCAYMEPLRSGIFNNIFDLVSHFDLKIKKKKHWRNSAAIFYLNVKLLVITLSKLVPIFVSLGRILISNSCIQRKFCVWMNSCELFCFHERPKSQPYKAKSAFESVQPIKSQWTLHTLTAIIVTDDTLTITNLWK